MEIRASRLEQFVFVSFLLLMFWLPIPLASNRPWAWSLMELWIALQTLALLWVYRAGLPLQPLRSGKWLLLGLLFFQAWTLLQLIPFPAALVAWLSPERFAIEQTFAPQLGLTRQFYALSLDPEQTLINLLKGCAYLLLAMQALLLINRPQRLRQLLVVLVTSGTFQAFYGAMLILSETTTSPVFGVNVGNVASGSFIYKNHFANYLMMVLTTGMGLIIADLHTSASSNWHIRIKRWLQAALSAKMLVRLCLVIMVIGLVMSRSRMGNSAFFFATMAGGIVALLFYKRRPRALNVLMISVLVIDTLIVSSLFGLDKVRERLESTVLTQEGRASVFEWSLDMLWDFPLFGTGAGSFYSVFQRYAQAPIGFFYDHVHNDYLQFLIESGMFASLVLAMMVLYMLWLALRTIRKRHTSLMKGTALGAFMAIVGMLIHISVDFNLQAPANAATFVVILALVCICAAMPRDGYRVQRAMIG